MKRISKILVVLLILAFSAPMFANFDPLFLSETQFSSPNWRHWLGTDQLGRDVYSRLVYGMNRSLVLSALATLLASLGGILLGLIASNPSFWLSHSARSIINSLLSLPGLLWSLVVITLLGSNSKAIVIAVGSAQIAPFARVIYSKALSVYKNQYVTAARSQGASEFYITHVHILPNCLSVLLAYGAVVFSYSILNVAALSFLGLAGSPGVADLGIILNEGRAAIFRAPWIALSSGLILTLLVLSINLLSDNLAKIT